MVDSFNSDKEILDEYKRLDREINSFYILNKEAIKRAAFKEKQLTIINEIQDLLSHNMIWCRNGLICSNATPCKKLSCKYKSTPDDVAIGCGKCQQFQITTGLGENWYTAKIEWVFGSTDLL